MEYLESKPLNGPMTWPEARGHALQLLEALETAHRAGITHRDVKPANIVLARTGIKLLDFGLAKAEKSIGPTDATLTLEGTIQGTPHYMAPEQAAGQEVDARADIFSFGAVLFEWLTGKRAFAGDSAAAAIGSVMKDDPLANAKLPENLQRILRRCLAKDRERRYQSARDVALDLEEVVETAPAAPSRRNAIIGTAAAAFAGGVGVASFGVLRKSAPEVESLQLSIPVPEGQRLYGIPSISPDGSKVTFVLIDVQGRRFRWVRDLKQSTPVQIPEVAFDVGVFWSPDSTHLGFLTASNIRKINLATGAADVLAEFAGANAASWCDHDTLIARRGLELHRVSLPNGQSAGLNIRGNAPRNLAGSRNFFYREITSSGNGDYVGASFDGKVAGKLVVAGGDARYGGGYLFYSDGERGLRARAFDPRRLTFTSDVVHPINLPPRSEFRVSERRDILFARAGEASETRLFRGDLKTSTPFDANATHAEFTANGKLLVTSAAGGNIWIHDLDRGTKSQVSFNGQGVPVWSHDESKIYFSGGTGAEAGVYVVPASGGKKPERIALGATHHLHASPDGAFLAATLGQNLIAISLKDGKSRVISDRPAFYDHPQFSPDSRWLTYSSDESGRLESYIIPFPAGGAKWAITNGGGALCRFRRDGKELYYMGAGGNIFAMDIDISGSEPKLGKPRMILELSQGQIGGTARFAATPDGKQFIASLRKPEATPPEMHIITNWRPPSGA